MPRSTGNSGSGSDGEGSVKSFKTAESGGSTISYTHATGSSAYVPDGDPVDVTASPATVSASPEASAPASVHASPEASPSASPPAGSPSIAPATLTNPPPVPATDPPGQNPVGVFDVEAQTYLAADQRESAVYRWSQGTQKWLGENREHVKRFALDAAPLILQAAGKGAQNDVGNYVNVVGVGVSGLKSAAYLLEAGRNYYNTGNNAHLAQGVAAAAGIAGAGMSAYGNDGTLPVPSQNYYQSVGAGLQGISSTWSYNSPTAPQRPAATDPASSTTAHPTDSTTVNPTSTPAPTASSSQPTQQSAEDQQPPIALAGQSALDRQDSMATGASTGSRPAAIRRTATLVHRTNSSTNGNGNGSGGVGRGRAGGS